METTNRIVTSQGKFVNPLDIQPEDIDVRDIARALSHICRYTGHTERFYSVAEHSVYVSRLAEMEAEQVGSDAAKVCAVQGLFHDAGEAYLSDIASPVKNSSDFEQYRTEENLLLHRILEALSDEFNLRIGTPLRVEVKSADHRIVMNEFLRLMPWVPEHLARNVVPYTEAELRRANVPAKNEQMGPAWGLDPEQAYGLFIRRMDDLGLVK